MEAEKGSIYKKIAQSYRPTVSVGVIEYLYARKTLGFYTDKLEEAILGEKIVKFAAGMRESAYDSEIVISLGLLNWQDKDIFESALKLAELMKRYPEESSHTLRLLSEITAMNIRLKNQTQAETFDFLGKRAAEAIGGQWEKGEIEKAMELVDRALPFIEEGTGKKKIVDCLEDLNEIALIFRYSGASKRGEKHDEAKDTKPRTMSQDEIYSKEEYDAYELDSLAKKILVHLLRRTSMAKSSGVVAQEMNESPASVDNALRELSKRGLAESSRFGYLASSDGRQYAKQHGLLERRTE